MIRDPNHPLADPLWDVVREHAQAEPVCAITAECLRVVLEHLDAALAELNAAFTPTHHPRAATMAHLHGSRGLVEDLMTMYASGASVREGLEAMAARELFQCANH